MASGRPALSSVHVTASGRSPLPDLESSGDAGASGRSPVFVGRDRPGGPVSERKCRAVIKDPGNLARVLQGSTSPGSGLEGLMHSS